MKDQPQKDIPQTPAYWFLLLEHARDHGCFTDAARYQDELRKLGVIIKWQKPRNATKAVSHAQ